MAELQDLIGLLYKTGCVNFGEFTLTSGKKSNVYIDMRNALSYVELRNQIVKLMVSKASEIDHETVVGIATGGLPWAAILAHEEEKPLAYVRKSEKEHGTMRFIEGNATGRCLVVDDVATTGGTIANAIDLIETYGGEVSYALVIVDRNEGAKENLRSIGVSLESVLTLSDILQYGRQKGLVDSSH